MYRERGGGAAAGQSFPQLQAVAVAAAGQDAVALALLTAWAAAVLWRAPPPSLHMPWYPACVASLLVLSTCLAWQRLSAQSWQRWRAGGAVAARLAAAALPLSLRLSVLPGSLLPGSPSLLLKRNPAVGVHGIMTFLFSAVFGTGALALGLTAIGLHLPPLLAAALQVGSTAAMVSTNAVYCSSLYLQHPQAQAYMAAAYRWLEPLIAPVEPLLWLAGISTAHPYRRCHCVAAVLQVWGGLVLPLLLVAFSSARAYRAYRLAGLQRLLLRQRQQMRAELRYYTRAAAAARRQAAASPSAGQAVHPNEHSSTSNSNTSSSPPSSPEASEEAQTVAAQAAALNEAPAPPGLLLPGDWQYEQQYQLYLRLQQLAGWPAFLVLAIACVLYAWHILAFP